MLEKAQQAHNNATALLLSAWHSSTCATYMGEIQSQVVKHHACTFMFETTRLIYIY